MEDIRKPFNIQYRGEGLPEEDPNITEEGEFPTHFGLEIHINPELFTKDPADYLRKLATVWEQKGITWEDVLAKSTEKPSEATKSDKVSSH